MGKTNFMLLNGIKRTSDKPSHAKLWGLKNMGNNYHALHNQLVETTWEIKFSIFQVTNAETKNLLVSKLDSIESVLKETNSERKLEQLLQKINQFEIELFGHSFAGCKPLHTL